MYMVYHGLTLEAYESEVDQILKDANAKVRKLAEAVESGTQDLGTHGLRMGSTYRECWNMLKLRSGQGSKAGKQLEALKSNYEDEKRHSLRVCDW